MRVVETQFSRLTLCDDGILEAHPIQRDAPRNGALLSETLNALEEVSAGEPRPVIWDPAGTLPLQPDGWQVIVSRADDLFAALAIVLDSEETPLLGAFPESMNALLVPVRVFDDVVAARRWLLQFVDAPAADR